jgi:cytochrome oxidase Cu insertion factor (SCO1/SenC/PrrC family)
VRSKPVSWLKLGLIVGAVVVGAGVGIGVAIAQGDSSSRRSAPGDPGTFFAAGSRPAPDFTLRDQDGRAIGLRSLRGRTVLLAFIDPVCRNYCPFEAKILNDVVSRAPAARRPAIVAVSVNPWNQTKADLAVDRAEWHLAPEWQWGLGSYAQLARVWAKYAIGVQVETKKLAGVTVHEVAHTEAAYVIDAQGDERALFIYPYRADTVARAVASIS